VAEGDDREATFLQASKEGNADVVLLLVKKQASILTWYGGEYSSFLLSLPEAIRAVTSFLGS
tara:strand:+ start:107 stop:292 length:186 start_codon:yes stop_codon:yes gene_type:complete